MALTGTRTATRLRQKSTRLIKYTGEIKANLSSDPDYVPPVPGSPLCTPGSTLYYNTGQNAAATKNNCTLGFSGSNEILNSLINDFESTVSVADANSQAQDYVDNAAQGNANDVGTCSQLIPTKTVGVARTYTDPDIFFTFTFSAPLLSDVIAKIFISGTTVAGPFYQFLIFLIPAGTTVAVTPTNTIGSVSGIAHCLAEIIGIAPEIFTNSNPC